MLIIPFFMRRCHCSCSGLYRDDARPGLSQFEKRDLFAETRGDLKWSAMSCLDVVYHQRYGARRYLPATSAAAAAVAYKAAYFHHQQQQQKKLCSPHSRMQDSADTCAQGKQTQAGEQKEERRPPAKGTRPAEAEYLSSRCVLFTYFQGEISDVVDEHFSRALSQPSAFSGDAKASRGPPGGPWRDGSALASGQCAGFPSPIWGSGYPSQSGPCLPSAHPDFSPGAAALHAPEPAAWAGPGPHQPGLPPPPAVPDAWHYALGSPSGAGYPHVHEMYPHVHPRHAHGHARHVLHRAHGPTLDPRFGPLLLPGARPPCGPASQCQGPRAELESGGAPLHGWPASFHGSVDIYDPALDQEKGKSTVWF